MHQIQYYIYMICTFTGIHNLNYHDQTENSILEWNAFCDTKKRKGGYLDQLLMKGIKTPAWSQLSDFAIYIFALRPLYNL